MNDSPTEKHSVALTPYARSKREAVEAVERYGEALKEAPFSAQDMLAKALGKNLFALGVGFSEPPAPAYRHDAPTSFEAKGLFEKKDTSPDARFREEKLAEAKSKLLQLQGHMLSDKAKHALGDALSEIPTAQDPGALVNLALARAEVAEHEHHVKLAEAKEKERQARIGQLEKEIENDLEEMLRRGLITQEQYDKLKKLKKDDPENYYPTLNNIISGASSNIQTDEDAELIRRVSNKSQELERLRNNIEVSDSKEINVRPVFIDEKNNGRSLSEEHRKIAVTTFEPGNLGGVTPKFEGIQAKSRNTTDITI